MTNRVIFGCVLGIAGALSVSASLQALNVDTHRLVNIAAADYEKFDQYIREHLGFAAGRNAVLRLPDVTASTLLADGALREDDGDPLTGRFYNHFHNPLKPWAEAGLNVAGQSTSSVRWMQDPKQDWGWKDAREFYRRAVTAGDPGTRKEAAANMFRALGQIMHLVVDASVPEHTRADPHPFGQISRQVLRRPQAGNYEYWVSDNQSSGLIGSLLSNPIGFDSSILQIPAPPGESVATVPIARLIDTDRYQYDGPIPPNPNVTLGGAIGLAEFSNANFFSEDTLDGSFPFPSRAGLTPSPQVAPKGSRVRAYRAKPAGQGLPTAVALAECITERSVGRWTVSTSPPYPCVDEAVWKETATHMLPRAVGYARGVLDYFFRGKLRVDFWTYLTEPPGTAGIIIVNESGESMSGNFQMYAGGTSERRQPASASYINVNSDPWSIYPGATFSLAPGEMALAMMAAQPAGVTDHILVFEGRLGLEENAVASDAVVLP